MFFFQKITKIKLAFLLKKSKFEGGLWDIEKVRPFVMPLLEGKPSMETKMMKKTTNLLCKWALGVCLLLAGVQNAFALQCEGQIHVQIPSSWTSPSIMVDGANIPLPSTALQDGWYNLDALSYGGQYAQKFLFMKASWNDPGITTNHYNVNGGQGGWDQADAFTCDDLSTGTLYIYEDPTTPGKTVYGPNPPNAKYFFVMIPPDMEDWMSSVPMLSLDGGQTGKPMTAVEGMCGWYSYVFFNEDITDNVLLYRDDDVDREDVIGVHGNWETANVAEPIPLGMVLKDGPADSLFFVPDAEQKTNEDGFYYSAAEVEGIEGTCTYTMAAIIYDTDAKLHPFFSCYSAGGEGCQVGAQGVGQEEAREYVNACLGVHQGLVEDNLDPTTKKPTLSTKGKTCFKDSKYFNQMFTYTENVNEKSCYDMPFKRSTDGKWEFDSDFYHSPGAKGPGGFYPAEMNNDSIILAADPSQKPIADARTKRDAEGPVFYGPAFRELDATEGMPKIDILCNGPGWNKGEDCEGKFNTGSDEEMAFAVEFVGGVKGTCVMGWSCEKSAPTGWHFFKQGTDTEVDPSTEGATYRWSATRNQHYCFESHAKFTHKPGLKFNFRGDDDIWVFIDNKLAVDLGGTHLAAPGYVDLDNFTGASGKLNVGDQYDLDIFFCDRRTTMSNVRIKTNMYIQQKTAIDVNPQKTGTSEKSYGICFTKTGDGSCAAAMTGEEKDSTLCGDDLKNSTLAISYTLVQGNLPTSPAVAGVENVSGDVYKCGIDLRNPANPKIDPESICGLGGGRYTLFVNIEGKTKKVYSFRRSGEVDVVYASGDAVDSNQVKIGSYTVQTTAMGGMTVPVYVSSLAPVEGSQKVEIYPDDAVGVQYTLQAADGNGTVSKLVRFCAFDGGDTCKAITPGSARTIGASGVDTVYATVPMQDLTSDIQKFRISVSGRPNALEVSFYLPKITFIEAIPEDGKDATSVTGQKKEADGSYEEFWVGSIYDMYLAVLKPNADGKSFSPCLQECNGLKIHKGSLTSAKIDFIPEEVEFVDGYATISIRSLVKYRWDTDATINSPATIVAEYNDYVQATYSPMYFRDPPVPYPVLADVFDVHGVLPAVEYKIPAPYFSMNQEYLDGVGDSVAIYYDRPIHKDSLPTKICVMWDSLTAEAHNPVKEGYSNISKDSAITCNELISVDASNIDCSSPVEYNGQSGYCSNLIKIGGLTLSTGVKTAGVGKVHSYAVFEDKGKQVKQGFAGALTDRIAPVPLRAEVRTIKNGDELTDNDSLVIIMSEPVRLLVESQGKTSVDFYLNSAVELDESARFVSSLENTPAVVTAQTNPFVGAANGEGRIRFLYKRGDVSPHVGDFLRLSGNLSNIIWSDADTDHETQPGSDTLRAVADAAYYWNSPTGYKETKRLPTPWIPVTGDAEIDVIENKFASTANGPAGDKVPAVTVNAYRTTMTKAEVFAAEGGKPGHLVKADMYALFNGLPDSVRTSLKAEDIFFYYEVKYFTNLGNFVAGKTKKIYCDDSKNTEVDPVTKTKIQYFNGGLCTESGNDRNFFIGWNMRSDKGRVVGTGAYIVKLNSYVKLGSAGKDAKQESTSVWGIKRSPKAVMDYAKAPAGK